MKRIIFTNLFILLSIVLAVAADVSFEAAAPKTVIVGEQFRLSYTINSYDVNERNLRLGSIDGFEVKFGPSTTRSSNTLVVNGKVSSENYTVVTYVLTANKEGDYTIGAATCKIAGANYSSNSVSIKVLPKDTQSQGGTSQGAALNSNGSRQESGSEGAQVGNNQLFIRTVFSAKNVYEQEPVLATLKLYTRVDISGLNNPKFPEFDGFLSQEIPISNQQYELENYNGTNYRTVIIKQYLLFPQRSGKLTVSPAKLDVTARVANKQRGRSIFDDFFDNYTEVNRSVSTPEFTIDVKPLPGSKPASFTGTVGDIKMNASISTTNLKANESLTLKIQFSGSGNLKLIKTPEVKFPSDFDVYDPKVDNNLKTTTSTMTGQQTIEYLAIPRHAGDFVIPPVEFSYFDLKSGQYKTLSTEEYKIHVEPGKDGENAAVVTTNIANKEDLKYLGKDIRYIYSDAISLHTKGSYFFGSIGYWICLILPTLLLMVFLIVYRKQAQENANVTLVRTKKASKVATKRLKMAGAYLKQHKNEAFYEELMRAMWGYVSDKLSIPVAQLTKTNVGEELTRIGADEQMVNQFMEVLHSCEFARYAPGSQDEAMDKLYKDAVAIIDKMETIIKK